MLYTVDEIKEDLGITSGMYDDFLEAQLELVSDVVEAYCRRKFSLATYVQTIYLEDMEGRATKSIPLFHYPLISITSITEKYNSSGTPIAISDYRFHTPTALISKNMGCSFFRNGNILEVVYTAGYAAVPRPIIHVVRSIVQERYNKKVNGIDLNFGSDIQRINVPGVIGIDFDYSLSGNERKTPFGSMLGNHINMLDAYRSERTVVGSGSLAYVN